MGHEKRSLGVFTGLYSKEFLEKMGYKPWFPPLVEVCCNPVMPMEPIKLAYEKVKVKDEYFDS